MFALSNVGCANASKSYTCRVSKYRPRFKILKLKFKSTKIMNGRERNKF